MARELHELLGIPFVQYKTPRSGTHYKPLVGRKIVNTIIQVMTNALLRGESISINNFGKFRVVERPATKRGEGFLLTKGKRTDFIQSNRAVVRPAKKVVIFTPSQYLRAAIKLTRGCELNAHDRRAMNSWK